MRRRLVSAAALCGLLALVPTVADAGSEPGPTTCTDGPTAIHAAPANPPGAPVTTNGTAGDDTIFGTDAPDVIDGRAGADCLEGGAGNDELIDGGRGDAEEDHIVGGAGNDLIRLANGNDGVVAGDGDDEIRAANGRTDFIDCGAGNDQVTSDLGDRLLDCESAAPANAVRRVSPRVGRRSTRFLVRFRRAIFNEEDNSNSFSIVLTPPEDTSCAGAGPRTFWDSTQVSLGRRIASVRLRGPGRRHRWCRGRWQGELVESSSSPSSTCDSGDANPLDCTGDTRIGTFSFRVR